MDDREGWYCIRWTNDTSLGGVPKMSKQARKTRPEIETHEFQTL